MVERWNGYMWTTVCVRPENDYPRTKRRSAPGKQSRHSTRFVRTFAKEQGSPMRWHQTKRHEDNCSHGQPWQGGPGSRKRSGRRPVFHVCAQQRADALAGNAGVHARSVCSLWGLQVHEEMQEEEQRRDLCKDMDEVARRNSIKEPGVQNPGYTLNNMPVPPVARWASRTRRGGRRRGWSLPGTGAAMGPACCGGCGQRRARKTLASSSSDVMSVHRRTMVSKANVESDSTSQSWKMCLHNGSQANQGPARTTKRKWTRNVIFYSSHTMVERWNGQLWTTICVTQKNDALRLLVGALNNLHLLLKDRLL